MYPPSKFKSFVKQPGFGSWRLSPLQQYFSYTVMVSFIGGRSRSARRESPIMGKQLVNFISFGCDFTTTANTVCKES
jgi:hypothetical protein